MSNSKIDKYEIGKIVTIIIVTLFVIWLVAQVLGSCNYGEKINSSDNLTILLSFIGVIATFIVINNISQVNEIRNQIKERQKEHEEKMADEIAQHFSLQDDLMQDVKAELEKQIKEVNSNVTKLRKDTQAQLKRHKSEYGLIEKNIIQNIITYFFDEKPLIDLIQKILPLDAKSEYVIRLKNGTEEQHAKIGIADQQIYCTTSSGNIIPNDEIVSIDDVEESMASLYYLYTIFVRSYETREDSAFSNYIEEISSNTKGKSPNYYNETSQ